MKRDRAQFQWLHPAATRNFRTGVSLHGHTLHSRECLSFLPRHIRLIPGGGAILRRHARDEDFARAYWTPPLTPASAFRLEQDQIAGLALTPVVSLTDHDDIEAGLSLLVTHRRAEAPVSVEWTVPFAGTIFHLGVHNLPPRLDTAWASAMSDFTADPSERLLPALLEGLSRTPGALVVLNHPFWMEEGVEEAVHAPALRRFLRQHRGCLHAFELNGTRPWKENRDTITLADRHEIPVISGGDRHAGEPSACINLTNASTFGEFAAEVRDGQSNVLFLPQYQEPMANRLLEAAWDILRPYPEYPGREHWTDRVFYQAEDGITQSLAELWRGRTPWPARVGAALIEFVARKGMRTALRAMLADRPEIAL